MASFNTISGFRIHSVATRNGTLLNGLRRYSKAKNKEGENYQEPVKTSEHEPVYIVTLDTSKSIQEPMTMLRRKYFPADKLRVDAHLTLFHALPESKIKQKVIPFLEHTASLTKQFFLRTGKIRRLSRGIAIDIGVGQRDGTRVRDKIKKRYIRDGWMSKQDRAKSVLHYTVMNKVENQEEIDRALQEIERDFSGAQGFARGLVLWRYVDAEWEFVQKFRFPSSEVVKQNEINHRNKYPPTKQVDLSEIAGEE